MDVLVATRPVRESFSEFHKTFENRRSYANNHDIRRGGGCCFAAESADTMVGAQACAARHPHTFLLYQQRGVAALCLHRQRTDGRSGRHLAGRCSADDPCDTAPTRLIGSEKTGLRAPAPGLQAQPSVPNCRQNTAGWPTAPVSP